MKAVWAITWRQFLRGGVRSVFAFLSIFFSSTLLSATLMGGSSLAACFTKRNENPLAMLMMAVAWFMAGILLVCTSFFIRNGFAASLSQRTRMLGQLASVGATRRQLRASVYLEALLLAATAIPLGISAAALGLSVAFRLLSSSAGVRDTFGAIMLHCPFEQLLSALGWSVLAVAVAAHGPARRAFRLSPLAACRQAQDLTPPVSCKRGMLACLPGPEGLLAARSLSRARPRFRTLVLGMAACIVLLLTTATFSGSVRSAYAQRTAPCAYRIFFWVPGETAPEQVRAVLDTARSAVETPAVTVEFTSFLGQLDSGAENPSWLHCVALDEESFEAWYGAPLPKEEGLPVVLALGDAGTEMPMPAVGQDMAVRFTNAAFHLAGTCETPLPLGIANEYKNFYSNGPTPVLVTTQSCADALFARHAAADRRHYAVYFDTQDGAALTPVLETSLAAPETNTGISHMIQDYTPTSHWALRRIGVTLLLDVFTWGFGLVVLLTCTAALISSVSAGLLLRRREFALLRSAGLTQAGVFRMLAYECMAYSVYALLLGLPVGLGLSWSIARFLLSQRLFEVLSAGTVMLIAAGVVAASLAAVLLCRRVLTRGTIVEDLGRPA